MKSVLVIPVLLCLVVLGWEGSPVEDRPNILWFVVDDMSANLSCYGETKIETPAIDRRAAEGLRFTRAYATTPVCSPFRSALITGMYQTTIGAHHHRSGRGERPVEELHAYQDDPWQIHNLAEVPEHADTLRQLRHRLERWIKETGDLGPESPEIYAREMANELNVINPASSRYETFRKNAELNRKWAPDGK